MPLEPRPNFDQTDHRYVEELRASISSVRDDLSDIDDYPDTDTDDVVDDDDFRSYSDLYSYAVNALDQLLEFVEDTFMYDPKDKWDPDFEAQVIHPKGWERTVRNRELE